MTKEEKAARKAARKEHNQQILSAWNKEKQEKKQKAKELHALRKARRKALPLWKKLLTICVRIIGLLLALAVVCILLLTILQPAFVNMQKDLYFSAGYQEPDIEAERAAIPADIQAQETIGAMPGYSKDDTWAIYLYIVGSNLESYGQDDLSDMIALESSLESQQISEENRSKTLSYLQTYIDSVATAGLELPSPMYHINAPEKAWSVPMTKDVVVSSYQGAASMDLDEIFKVALPQNVSVVIQTGGATHWSNARINPNRVQTFEYSSKGLYEKRNMPAYSMSTVDALSDFLSYCRDNNSADHQVLIMWDHGGGAFGFGVDEIYGKMMSLTDIQQALSSVYTADVQNPAFELIGFDACLMAGGEVMDALDGYGRYFAGSEESEPGFGWFYTPWLNELAENPAMNGAQLGLAIADSYMDFYARMERNILNDIGIPFVTMDDITFSVLDIHKAAQAYRSYVSLMETVLAQSIADHSVLTDVSQAAKGAIHYGSKSYAALNTIDLGTFLDGMPICLADKTDNVKAALKDSVLYVRSASALEGSTGLSVYFPDTTTEQSSILYLMKYITEVSGNDAINAMYFYKAAGCLTEDMQTWLAQNGYGEWDALDLSALKDVAELPVTLGGNAGFSVTVPKEAQQRMTAIGLSVGAVDEDNIIYYGTSSDALLTEHGELATDFDGKWICIDGQPLSVEIVFNSAETITYHSSILLNGSNATLVFSYDKSAGEFSILGAYEDDEAIDGDFIGRNISDLTVGSTIIPKYRMTDAKTLAESTAEGKKVRYGIGTEISLDPLPDGNYLSMISFGSIRGDEFNTGTVELRIRNGKISQMSVSEAYSTTHNR